MKRALVGDQLVIATADAPARAICPRCEGVVELRGRLGTWFWRHVALPRGGCRPPLAAAPDLAQATADAGDGATANASERPSRQAGAFVIELYPDESGVYGPHLKLRNPSVEEFGDPLRPGSHRPASEAMPGGQALRQGSHRPASEAMPGGQASGMVIYPSEVRLLARTLIDAAADLVELVVGVPRQAPRQARDVARDDN